MTKLGEAMKRAGVISDDDIARVQDAEDKERQVTLLSEAILIATAFIPSDIRDEMFEWMRGCRRLIPPKLLAQWQAIYLIDGRSALAGEWTRWLCAWRESQTVGQ